MDIKLAGRNPLHRAQYARVLVPRQQRVLAAPRLRVLNVRPALHKVLMAHHRRQLARDGAVNVLDDIEVRGEEDVEVALVDLCRNLVSDKYNNRGMGNRLRMESTPAPSFACTASAPPVRSGPGSYPADC